MSWGLSWSADGSKLAFQSDRDGQSEIYVMNPDGTGQTRLTNDPRNDTSPAWSADGSTILFTTDRGGVGADRKIFVMKPDGTGRPTDHHSTEERFPDSQPLGSGGSDTAAPVLTLPANQAVNATSAAGAAVTFAVSATDDVDPSPR